MTEKNNTTKPRCASRISKKNSKTKRQLKINLGCVAYKLNILFILGQLVLGVPIMVVLNAFMGQGHNWPVYLSSSIVSLMISGVVLKLFNNNIEEI